MGTEETAVIPPEPRGRRFGLLEALAAIAVLVAVAALAISLLHAGPKGAAGAQGPQGQQGAKGIAGSTADTTAIVQCMPELIAWINAFNVQTTSNNNSGTSWLTGAYLDTSQQQVSAPCKKVLGLK